MQFLSAVDLVQNELQEAKIQNLAVAPLTPVVGQIYYDTVQNDLFVWTGTIWKASGGTSKFAATIGNGILLIIPVTHNLNTRDVIVSVYDTTTFNEVIVNVQNTTVNTVTLTFTVPPLLNQYRVTVVG